MIEGADGTGKSTQLAMLEDRLRAAGRTVSTYDFPSKSGTPIGELIGSFLRGAYGEVAPEFLALAFSADRLSRRAAIIADLDQGHVVLCDRYVASNIAFQSSKTGEPDRRRRLEEMLSWVEHDVMALPRPDLQIVLVAPDRHFTRGAHLDRTPDPSRAYSESADIHESRLDLQLAVNAYYRGLRPSDTLRRIDIGEGDGRLSRDELAALIWTSVQDAVEPTRSA